MEVSFNKVDFSYNKSNNKNIENININIEKPSINCILGKSGSGKTTLGYLLNGLLLPTNGEIYINEYVTFDKENVNKMRFEIGFVLEDPDHQFFTSTIRKEIMIGMSNFKYKLDKKDKHILESLKIVGLDETYLDRDPFTLSSGEKKLVALASILAFNPKIIILDEFTIGLDYYNKRKIFKLLKMLKRRYNKTIIILGNDVDFINEIGDYLYVLESGKIVLEGSPKKVFMSDSYNLKLPKIVEFEKTARDKKNIKMIYRTEINDLIKEIYRAK